MEFLSATSTRNLFMRSTRKICPYPSNDFVASTIFFPSQKSQLKLLRTSHFSLSTRINLKSAVKLQPKFSDSFTRTPVDPIQNYPHEKRTTCHLFSLNSDANIHELRTAARMSFINLTAPGASSCITSTCAPSCTFLRACVCTCT